MSLFLRIFQHLLPNTPAWRLSGSKTIRKFFDGLTAVPEAARLYADLAWQDLFPTTTRQLPAWLTEFGIEPTGYDPAEPNAALRLQLDSAWKAQGGQSPKYIQDLLQAAGFPLFVHQWWKSTPEFVSVCCGDTLAECGEPAALAAARGFLRFTRNPTLYTNRPAIGTWECDSTATQPECTPLGDGFAQQPQCDSFLSNEPLYIVNLDLSRNAPPPIPDDESKWPYFIYLGEETFPAHATVPLARRSELERLVLKLRPAQQWIVMLVDYVDDVEESIVNASAAFLQNASGSQLVSVSSTLVNLSGSTLVNAGGSTLLA